MRRVDGVQVAAAVHASLMFPVLHRLVKFQALPVEPLADRVVRAEVAGGTHHEAGGLEEPCGAAVWSVTHCRPFRGLVTASVEHLFAPAKAGWCLSLKLRHHRKPSNDISADWPLRLTHNPHHARSRIRLLHACNQVCLNGGMNKPLVALIAAAAVIAPAAAANANPYDCSELDFTGETPVTTESPSCPSGQSDLADRLAAAEQRIVALTVRVDALAATVAGLEGRWACVQSIPVRFTRLQGRVVLTRGAGGFRIPVMTASCWKSFKL